MEGSNLNTWIKARQQVHVKKHTAGFWFVAAIYPILPKRAGSPVGGLGVPIGGLADLSVGWQSYSRAGSPIKGLAVQ